MVSLQQVRKRVAGWTYPPYRNQAIELAIAREVAAAAHIDPLTGAGTRQAYDHFDATELGKALHRVVIDLDHFKGINDSLGHQVGDRVLGYVGESIRLVLAMYGLSVRQRFYRYGGDELVACVEAELAAQVARSIDALVATKLRPSEYRDLPAVTVSCGYGSDFQTADTALYRVKMAR